MELENRTGYSDQSQPSESGISTRSIEAFERSPLAQYRGETYYRLPAVKSSYYGWKIGASFFSVGLGGASQILATIIDLTGKEKDRSLIRTGRYLAFSSALVTSALYIIDLHTPQRWYQMMRIFKKTSWMSIGSWCLASFGALSAATAGAQFLEDAGWKRLGKWTARLFQFPAALAGGMVTLYSGAELEATNLPLWERAYPLLPALFAAEHAASAASAMVLVTRNSEASDGMRKQLERFSFLAGAVEEILYRLASSRWQKNVWDGFSRPSPERSSPLSSFQRLGTILSVFTRMVRAMKERPARKNPLFSSLLTLGSGFLLPVQILLSGNRSGQKPEEYLSDTQPAALSERERFAGREDSCKRAKTAPREHAPDVLLGLGLFAIGASVFFLFSKKRGGNTRESSNPAD